MKTLPILAWLGVALGVAPIASAQTVPSEIALRVSEARKANTPLMQQYSWTSRTEVIDRAEVKHIRIDTVSYGPDGQLQRTVLDNQSRPVPVGFRQRGAAEYERQNVQEYLTGLRDLLEQYTLSTPGKVQDFLNQATASERDTYGLFAITGRNLVRPGDTLSVWVDPRTRHPQRIRVSTTFEGEPVTLTATFETLPSGLNHIAYAEVRMPARQISVQVQNFDYNRDN